MGTERFTFIKTEKKFVKLNFSSIAIVKGLGNYVEIFTTDNKKFIYYKSLKELIDSLPDEFMRVHNSYIINLANIESFEGNQVSIGTKKITVAKSYKECFVKALNKLML